MQYVDYELTTFLLDLINWMVQNVDRGMMLSVISLITKGFCANMHLRITIEEKLLYAIFSLLSFPYPLISLILT